MDRKKEIEELIESHGYKNILYVEEHENAKPQIYLNYSKPEIFQEIVNFVNEKIDFDDKIRVITEVEIKLDLINIEENKGEIKNLVFQEKVVFSTQKEYNYVPSFHNCYFLKNVKIAKSSTTKNLAFYDCGFYDDVKLSNNTYGSLDFNTSVFKKPIEFKQNIFKNFLSFKGVHFLNTLSFDMIYLTKEAVMLFESVQFHSLLQLAGAGIDESVHFYGIEFKNKNISNITKAKNSVETAVTLSSFRESFRLIKNYFEKNGNRIEALKFKAYEMDMYRHELEQDKEKQYSEDWLIMKANYWSNNFGLSWKKGIMFTLWSTYITYIVMLIILLPNTNFRYSTEFSWEPFYHYVQLLNVTKWDIDFIDSSKNNQHLYIILYVGRIFIGFGYYQTIQAFRKYGR